MARPTIYSQELADTICERLSEGESLRTVCKSDDMPSASSVFNWLRTQDGFVEQYARAKQESADAMAEEIMDIGEDALADARQDIMEKGVNAVVQAHKLRLEARKWLMSKMKPKKYGDKLDLTSDGKALPTPIMHVQRDSSDQKDKEAE